VSRAGPAASGPAGAGDPARRARARDLGLAPGTLPAGPVNAITDVPGIRVGQVTLIEGTDIRTGVTAIVHDTLLGRGPGAHRTLPAGLAVFNGFGKMTGSTQIAELGCIETPVLLTATLSVFRVADALLSYLHQLPAYSGTGTLNPVVAETNDSYLSDIWARPVTAGHVAQALDSAAAGPVGEGCAGAGTGTSALGFKAGIGTSSRRLDQAAGQVTLGVLVQANFGGELTVLGVPVPRPPGQTAASGLLPGLAPEAAPGRAVSGGEPGSGSCVIVLATDAALGSRQLQRLASRAFAGMARTGSDFSGRSGDYALAVSTATGPSAATADGHVPEKDLDLLFQAAIEATEEAILNSLFMAQTTTGYLGHVRQAVPLDYVSELVRNRSARRNGW
jgi:D-aminopeptidase